MNRVKPKKRYGQHFLNDPNIAKKIIDSIGRKNLTVIEIGPGEGMLTHYLIKDKTDFRAVEIDRESYDYLCNRFPEHQSNFIFGDFLKMDIRSITHKKIIILGNFPYNISSQIFFKIMEQRDLIEEVICMVQKEVAERIASKPGNKTYGILSVLLQAFFQISYLFTVNENVFFPAPKVKSAVISLSRNNISKLNCDEDMFFKIVKLSFNQRRKQLKNSLKSILVNLPLNNEILQKRPEQLDVDEFVHLTNLYFPF